MFSTTKKYWWTTECWVVLLATQYDIKNSSKTSGIIKVKMHYYRKLYCEILERYELEQSDPAKINVWMLSIFFVASSVNFHQETIVNCFWHCKIRSEDGISTILEEESTSENDIHELEVVINFGYRNRIDVNSLLNYPGENDTCLEVQSL